MVDYAVGFGTPLKDEAIVREPKDPDPGDMLDLAELIGTSLHPIPEVSVHQTTKDMLTKTSIPVYTDIITEDMDGGLHHLLWDEELKKRWGSWFPIMASATTDSPPAAFLPFSSHRMGDWSGKGKIPQGDREKMAKRLKKLQGTSPWAADKRTGEPVKSTPIVFYYITRYLAAHLIDSEMAEEAMPKKEGNSVVTNRMSVSMDRKEINQIMTELFNHEATGHSTIDYLFDFSPIGTQIRYPADWKDGDPQPMATDQNTIPGLLQKLYSRLGTGAQKEFKNDVKDLITSLPHSSIHISDDGSWTLATLEPEVAEAAIVWIEEMEIGGGGRQNIRGTYDLSTSSEKLTPGAILSIPGILLLMNQSDNGANILNRIFGNIVIPPDPDPDYADYVNAYFDREAENDFRIEEIARDEDDGMEISEEARGLQAELAEENTRIKEAKLALRAFIKSNITATIASITPTEVTLILEDLPDSTPIEEGLTVYISPDLFKGLHAKTDSEKQSIKTEKTSRRTGIVTSRFLFDTLPWSIRDLIGPEEFTAETDEIDEDGLGYFDLPYTSIDSEDVNRQVEFLRPILLETAPEYSTINYANARGFAALGEIIGWCIIRTSSSVAETMTQTSYFDNIVNALTGRENDPGLAAYHAVIHYKFLFEQLREAITGGEAGLIQEGRSLSLEIYADDPAKLMLYWLLTETGYIDIAGLDDNGIPNFFTVPLDEMGTARTEASLMNGLALLVIGYYRLAFSQLRLRRFGSNMKQGEVPLSNLWAKLTKEAKGDPPEPHAFATVLRFMSGPGKALRIPAWMTTLPKGIIDKKKDRDSDEVQNYLKWAYGDNPQSIEVFAEVSAAYHAAKALSYYEPGDYQEMTEAFVDGVARDKGHPFLVALLLLDVSDEAVFPQMPLPPVPLEATPVAQAGDWRLGP